MNKCRFLKIRSKKGKLYHYCKNKREIVEKGCYIGCPDKEYKKYKPIKKVSKNKETVSPETYANVYMRDNGTCQLCFRKDNTYDYEKEEWIRLEAHHIRYKSERKDLIDEPSNLIMLCSAHHREVHSNKKKWQPILLKMIKTKEDDSID